MILFSIYISRTALKKLSEQSPYEEARNQAKGALWIIEGKDEQLVHHGGGTTGKYM